ncbi:unnamed protein product [Triticum turgidum subsp. durum]|uniref:KIB1-4 beta-propeller domain-containing protein n=1 Tax=Triticum turgidum subsp. durum TaxID=4567 RepID=A0A9R0SNM7_TRITD|nr:unnamed protein product [Triticum turgidum subsp. durum]
MILRTWLCMMEAARYRPWSDLLPELLNLVLKRLPSLADRVRLRAVCHPWRSNCLLQPLPVPFPWLTLPDGTFLCIPGGEVHRMPAVPDGVSCRGSIDNWLFLMSSDDACTLMNPFSKTTLELPNLVSVWQRKPPMATYSLRDNRQPLYHPYDVAFFDGKLYVVSSTGKLFILEFRSNLGSIPNIKCVIESLGVCLGVPECVSREKVCTFRLYLVECGGRLLMVQRFIRHLGPLCRDNIFENMQTIGFVVVEADLHSEPCRWRMISELGGHALFVGKHGSKSLPARECSGSQEDCIYFICDYAHPKFSMSPFHDSGVYNMRNGRITPLMSQTAAPAHDACQWRPTWVFHAGAV